MALQTPLRRPLVAPTESAPDQTAPDQTAPDQTAPDQTAPDQTARGTTATGPGSVTWTAVDERRRAIHVPGIVVKAVLPLVVVGLWWRGSNAGWWSAAVVPGPVKVVHTFGTLIANGSLPSNLWVSLRRAALGGAIGVSTGLALGVASGLWRRAEEALDPTLQMMRTLPSLVLLPLFIVWFGIGETSKIVIIALGSMFPMYLNTFAGIRNVGMEFSGYYTVAPASSSMTRSMSYLFGRYTDVDGQPLDFGAGEDFVRTVARALLQGPVYTTLDRMPEEFRARMPQVQPNFMLPFDRRHIDPFRDRFEVTLHGEGTIRGTGGVRVADASCGTGVPGLFVAGDTASREPVAGATSGGGAQNSAWALSSGTWAGTAAARHAAQWRRHRRGEPPRGIGRAGLRPSGPPLRREAGRGPQVAREVAAGVKGEILPLDKNLFRTEERLRRSLRVLDDLWAGGVTGLVGAAGDPLDALKAREAAALAANARWSYRAALARPESRGLHGRDDLPGTDPGQARRLVVAGIDEVAVRPEGRTVQGPTVQGPGVEGRSACARQNGTAA